MTIETWLAFTAATTVLLIIPGPTVLLVVSYALGQGLRAALPMALGVALGDFTAMTAPAISSGSASSSGAPAVRSMRAHARTPRPPSR